MSAGLHAEKVPSPASGFSSVSSQMLQRKCACGGSSGLTGSCSSCEKKKLPGQPLQTKLRINEPGDQYEQEADRVAAQVMRMAEPGKQPDNSKAAAAPLVQRKVKANSAGLGAAPPIVHDVLSSPGQPLDAATRAFFEPHFGHDFSNVRVHEDPIAARSAMNLGAQAYTVGNHLVFGSGRYAPQTWIGHSLIAHELVHLVQQGGYRIGEVPFIQRREVGEGFADESPAACDQPAGTDTITFAEHLATDVRTVQVHYHKEEPPGSTVQIPHAELFGNLFTEHPLIKIVMEQSCGNWIRFDVTNSPPGWQGPSLDDDSITIWGLAPPSSPGTTTAEILQEPKELGQVFVGDQYLYDFIIRQRQFTRKDDKEAFDLRVIDEFFAGIGEGLGPDFSAQWNTLLQTYAQHAVFFPFLQFKLWLGALDGIAEEGAETLVFFTRFAQDPQAVIDQVTQAIRRGVIQPRSTSRQFGNAIGQDLKQQVGALISEKNREHPGEFLYALGKIVGPVLLEIVLTIIAPESFVLRGVGKVGGKLLDFVDEVFDLGDVGRINWKPFIAESLDDASAMKKIGEILRGDGVRLKSGHEIRIIDNGIERCSSCSILARVYSPVLEHPEATAFKDDVARIQREVNELLAAGEPKEEVLAVYRDEIARLGNEIENFARANDIEFDRLTENNVLALERLFGENAEAVDSMAALGAVATNTLLDLPQPAQALFKKLWEHRIIEYRKAAGEILTDSRLTTADQRTKVLVEVKSASDNQLRAGGVDRTIRRILVPQLGAGTQWRNPGFQITKQTLTAGQGLINPMQLRCAQSTARPVFQKDAIPIQNMANLLSDPNKSWQQVHQDLGLEGIDGRYSIEITQIRVGKDDVRLITMDHRRVICAQAAYTARGGLVIPYTMVAPDPRKIDILKDLPERATQQEIIDLLISNPDHGLLIKIN